MNAPTRPPLYAYQQAYKTKERPRRVNRFTDVEYNRLVNLISYLEQKADFKAHFRVYASQKNMNELYHLLYRFISPKDMNEYTGLGFIRVNYTANKAGRKAAARDFEYLVNIKNGGKIVRYDPSNPRYVQNEAGNWFYTEESTNYNTTHYTENPNQKDNPTEYVFVSNDLAKNMDDLLNQNEDEKNEAETKNYVLIGVIAVALIIMIWTVKKNN